MPFYSTVYGLNIQLSAPVNGLIPSPKFAQPDLVFELNEFLPEWLIALLRDKQTLWYSSPKNSDGQTELTIWELADDAHFRMAYMDGTEFILDKAGTHVWSSWPSHATIEDSASYILGEVLGFVLQLRGMTGFHASAVVIDENAVVFMGPSGAGKSTTAAAFALAGYPVLSDDIVALTEREGRIFTYPGYPHIRLWPDSAESLYGSPDALPRLTPADGINGWWDKRYLDLNERGYAFARKSYPLAAIYVLGLRCAPGEQPHFANMPPQKALLNLVANTCLNLLVTGPSRAREFEFLGRVIAQVSIREATAPGLSELPDFCSLVRDDLRVLKRRRPPAATEAPLTLCGNAFKP